MVKGYATTIIFIDLYAGKGRYDDGVESTPLLILRRAIDDPVVSQMLFSIFNDKDHAAALRAEIDALPRIEKLKYKPGVYGSEVGTETPKVFERVKSPGLAFLDPWGYKGLSLDLIQTLLKNWGCEVLFFFNFNRVNMDITNPKVTKHMEALFGDAVLADLRQEVRGLTRARRRRAILKALKGALRERGGEYVRPFRFLRKDGRTSHYLIFVTKSFTGMKIMRDVMAGASSSSIDGVASFTYDPRPPRPADEGQMEFPPASPLDGLKARILRDLAGTSYTVREIFGTRR